MSKTTMSAVLGDHRFGHVTGNSVHCTCDPEVGYSVDRFHLHQEEELKRAGFGDVLESGAQAMDFAALTYAQSAKVAEMPDELAEVVTQTFRQFATYFRSAPDDR